MRNTVYDQIESNNRLRDAFVARRGSAVGARWRGYVGHPFRIIARVRPAEIFEEA